MIKIEKRKKDLISILSLLNKIVIETDVTFNDKGMFIKAIHSSNHCMLMINISPSFFEEYSFEKEITYTLNMEKLLLLIKSLDKGLLKITPSNDVLLLEDEKHSFELNYFVGNKDERDKPVFEQGNSLKISCSEFFSNIDKLMLFNEIGKFQIIDNNFYIVSKSHLIKGKIKLESEVMKTNDKEIYYDITYIEKIKDIKNLFKDINIEYDDSALVVSKKDDNINFEFILASREDEQNEN